MILSAMFAASMLLADPTPSAATATDSAAPPPAASAPAKPDKPKLVCRTESVTGSMFPKKICTSSDDDAQRRQEQRQNLERIQQQGHGPN